MKCRLLDDTPLLLLSPMADAHLNEIECQGMKCSVRDTMKDKVNDNERQSALFVLCAQLVQ